MQLRISEKMLEKREIVSLSNILGASVPALFPKVDIGAAFVIFTAGVADTKFFSIFHYKEKRKILPLRLTNYCATRIIIKAISFCLCSA